MKCLALILFTCCFCCDLHAQESTSPTMEQQLEDYTENMEDAETSDDTWLQQVEYLKNNPIDLNTAEEDDLKNLQLLTALQIENFLQYRYLLGKLISIYELQAVPGWDLPVIQKILPYITIKNSVPPAAWLKHAIKTGDYSFVARYGSSLEKAKGYYRDDSAANFYTGDHSRILLRLKYQYKNQLQYGITAAKDAGEPLFSKTSRSGFDFYSFHIFSRRSGIIKTVALGDYTVNMGQGLIYWQGMAFGKGAGITNIKRQSAVLRPYNSAGAFYFNRGAAVTLHKNQWETTLFASLRKLDANVSTDSMQYETVSSIPISGYHRTQSEQEHKASLQLFSYGATISYRTVKWRIDLNAVQYHFDKYIRKEAKPYNLYAMRGNYWANYSISYHYTLKNIHVFGETAIDKNRNTGFINGLLAGLHSKVDFTLLHRFIAKAYQALYGNAFTVNTNPGNEHGIYIGLSLKLHPLLKLDGYTDLFSFPWLKYRVDAPSSGREYFVQLTYQPSKQTEIYSRYRHQQKPVNNSDNINAQNIIVDFSNRSWRTQLNHQANANFSVRQRFELLWYHQDHTPPEKGFLLFFDAFYKPKLKPFGINVRLQYFESNSYNSRLYAYENDVLFYFSVPVFYDKGTRYYININYKLNKQFSLWFKWAQTVYSNKTSIGSGLDEIQGNQKSEIRLLLSAHF